MKGRTSLVAAAVLTVALWIAGVVVENALPSNIADGASDAQVLAWVKHNDGTLIVGAWLFMLGCVAFVVFAGLLRDRFARAEGGNHLLANIMFGGAIAAAVCGLGTNADIASAINKNDVSPATAGAFHHLGDLFFMGMELMVVPFIAAACVLAFRAAVLPRWWAVVGLVVAVVLVIGPIGWAALIFGTPIWTVGTSLLAGRASRRRTVAAPATA
ncbi:MAG TPA: DUF4386 family protein [Gaiellaceae bacterium]|nr:DUF4386 family protein [Gaiellaceae bacterium]